MDAPATNRREWMIPLLLAVLSTLAVVVSIEPFPVGVFQDDGIYTVLGKSLATGQGYRYLNMPGAPDATHFPPLYPLVLAALWKVYPVFPANITLFKFANAVFIGLGALFAWRFARRSVGMGTWEAAITVGAFTTCAPIVLISVAVMSEPLFIAALFPVLMLCHRATENENDRTAFLAGAAGGILSLVRTLGFVVLPATVLVLAWRRRWKACVMAAAGGLATMLPWQLWIGAHDAGLPDVLVGKYGSYGGWLFDGMREGGLPWVMELVWFNTRHIIGGGWDLLAVNTLPAPVRFGATAAVTVLFFTGWYVLLKRAPVAALTIGGYLALVLMWPFGPQRFTFGIWPLLGLNFGLGAGASLRWRPSAGMTAVLRTAAISVCALLAVGYAASNYRSATRRWWSSVQEYYAGRSKPMAAWVMANTPEDAIISTEDDVMINLYTGRRAVPIGTFTPADHMTPQSDEFASNALGEILNSYDVDYVLATTPFGLRAAHGLATGDDPRLRLAGSLELGVVFERIDRSGTR